MNSTLAANFIYSTIGDISKAGRAILSSTLLSQISTNRWLKPIVQSSNAADDVGAPWSIYRQTLSGKQKGTLVPSYTQFGTQGLYSSYIGFTPDYGIGFVILSADTTAAADLNAHVDLIAEYITPIMEKVAMHQAAHNYAGNYTTNDFKLQIRMDGLSGLSLTNWTRGAQDIRAGFADLNSIAPATADFRLYPTNLINISEKGSKQAFRAVLQDMSAPIDAGTPTCISWMANVDKFIYNGASLDEFVFELDQSGAAVSLEIPAFNVTLKRTDVRFVLED